MGNVTFFMMESPIFLLVMSASLGLLMSVLIEVFFAHDQLYLWISIIDRSFSKQDGMIMTCMPIVSGLLWLILPPSVPLFSVFLFSWISVGLIWIDCRAHCLPDIFCQALLWSGLLMNSYVCFVSLNESLWGAVFAYIIFLSVYWLFRWIAEREGLGWGDIKLAAALGAWVGYRAIPWMIFLASITTLILLWLRYVFFNQSTKTPIAFAPGLTIAAGMILIFLTKGAEFST